MNHIELNCANEYAEVKLNIFTPHSISKEENFDKKDLLKIYVDWCLVMTKMLDQAPAPHNPNKYKDLNNRMDGWMI